MQPFSAICIQRTHMIRLYTLTRPASPCIASWYRQSTKRAKVTKVALHVRTFCSILKQEWIETLRYSRHLSVRSQLEAYFSINMTILDTSSFAARQNVKIPRTVAILNISGCVSISQEAEYLHLGYNPIAASRKHRYDLISGFISIIDAPGTYHAVSSIIAVSLTSLLRNWSSLVFTSTALVRDRGSKRTFWERDDLLEGREVWGFVTTVTSWTRVPAAHVVVYLVVVHIRSCEKHHRTDLCGP